MFQYAYLENLTAIELNVLGGLGWEAIDIVATTTNSFNVVFSKGFQEKTLITSAATGSTFWVDKTFSYGESIIIIFLTIFIFALIGKIVYNFLFKNV